MENVDLAGIALTSR